MEWTTLIDQIVNEVIKRLAQRPSKALVLFSGAAIGFAEAMEGLKKLKQDGWELQLALSNSAERVLTENTIQEILGPSNIILERNVTGLKPLYSGVDLLIIPTLTMNSAAKIALGIEDSMITDIVAHAIMQGIPIIAAKDGCDLQNPVRLQLGMNKAPIAYLNKMKEQLLTLEAYGIKLVDAKQLYEYASKKNSFIEETTELETVESIHKINKKVLSRTDIIETANKGKILMVSSQTIITSLAKDTAKELGVIIKIQ